MNEEKREEKRNWFKDIWDPDIEGKSENELDECPFNEYNKDGNMKGCWFIPGPEVCLLCLLGQLAGQLGYLRLELQEIAEKRK